MPILFPIDSKTMVNFWNDYLYLEALGNLKRLNFWHSSISYYIWIIMIDGTVAICTSWIILPRLKVPVHKFLSRQFVLTVLGDLETWFYLNFTFRDWYTERGGYKIHDIKQILIALMFAFPPTSIIQVKNPPFHIV